MKWVAERVLLLRPRDTAFGYLSFKAHTPNREGLAAVRTERLPEGVRGGRFLLVDARPV
jgi:hypothetical protein